MVSFWTDWPEIIAFIILIISFFVALGAGSAIIAYTLVFMAGLIGGRIWFRVKTHFKVSWSIILMGMLVGFMIGSRYGDRRIIVIFYIFGIVLSYFLHDRGIIKSLEI